MSSSVLVAAPRLGLIITSRGAFIAYTSVAVFERISVVGGLYALNGQVSLLGNKITKTGSCSGIF